MLNIAAKQIALQILGQMMSTISERSTAAGWYSGCEESIPRAALEYANKGATIAPRWAMDREEAIILCALAELVGSWATYNPDFKNESPEYIAYHLTS